MHGDGVAHVTIGFEASPVPGLPGRDFRGMSAHYLHTVRDGDRLRVMAESAGAVLRRPKNMRRSKPSRRIRVW